MPFHSTVPPHSDHGYFGVVWQICDFAEGEALDTWLKRLWLEEGGGGSGQESYELTAFYYAHHCNMAANRNGKKGYFFFTGDEGYYPWVKKDQVQKWVGDPIEADLDAIREFQALQDKFEVFFCFPRKSMEEKIANIDAEIDKRLKREGEPHLLADGLAHPTPFLVFLLGRWVRQRCHRVDAVLEYSM